MEKAHGVLSYVAPHHSPEPLVDVAEECEADMIIMGTHGRKGIDRILFGSVAEKVVKNSPIPVLTIRPSGHYTGGAMYKD